MQDMLKRTPLFENHLALKAKMVPFSGWEMPLQYSGIVEEHHAVRKNAGIFDLSHMGEIEVTGEDACRYIDRLITGNLPAHQPGQALYTVMCNEKGGILDDLVVYCMNQKYMLVVNASNTDKIFRWMQSQRMPGEKAHLHNRTDEIALIAVQGPNAEKLLQPLCSAPLGALKYYRCAYTTIEGAGAMISRTGYTGEDGFELYIDAQEAGKIWDLLIQKGIIPVGLGARDTLRLEAGYLLYGNDMDENCSPLEAGLSWVVKRDKGEFMGKKALLDQSVTRKLIPFSMTDPGIPRSHYPVAAQGKKIGTVTSGAFSPTLKKGIGFALVESALLKGNNIQIEVRGKNCGAEIVKKPFVKGSVKS